MARPDLDDRQWIAALDNYRIERDWSFEELATAMKRHKCVISKRTLHYLCKRLPAEANPLDRTVYKIKKFLKSRHVGAHATPRKPRAAKVEAIA
jgi:hypothetical protein